jgi:CrcB protein
MTIVLAGLGASVGALLRFLTTQGVNRLYNSEFPVATFLINAIGAFVLGILFSTMPNTPTYTLVGTGVLGGFTTFSTFMNEAVNLGNTRRNREVVYVIVSIITGLLMSALGIWLGNQL